VFVPSFYVLCEEEIKMTDKLPENDFGGTGVGWPADFGVSDGPAQFAKAATAKWVNDEHPTSDLDLFAELAARLSPMQG